MLLLFVGCAKEKGTFTRDEDGYGYTDEKSGVHYVIQDATFEAARAGEEIGYYEEEKSGYQRKFHAIPELDSARFLTDGSGNVYCADGETLDVSSWMITNLYVCEEDAVGVARGFVTDAASLASIKAAWLDGEEAELPLTKATHARRLKMVSSEHPNIYYCISFFVYEDGSAYFRLAEERITRAVPSEITAILLAAEKVAE